MDATDEKIRALLRDDPGFPGRLEKIAGELRAAREAAEASRPADALPEGVRRLGAILFTEEGLAAALGLTPGSRVIDLSRDWLQRGMELRLIVEGPTMPVNHLGSPVQIVELEPWRR